MIEVQGDVITALQLVTVLGSVDVFLGIVPGAEVNWALRNHQQTVAVAVSQCRPADMLTVAVVLREGIVLEHGIDGAAPDIDDVSLLAVGVVFARSTTVIRHLIVFAVNPHGETDARNDVRIVAVTLAGKRHVNLAIGSDAPDVGAAHPEVKHRRGNNCAADDQHFTIALFYGKVAQMFLHDLQMIRLPQPFVLLLVVVDHWLEEVDLWLAGQQRLAIHLPGCRFATHF